MSEETTSVLFIVIFLFYCVTLYLIHKWIMAIVEAHRSMENLLDKQWESYVNMVQKGIDDKMKLIEKHYGDKNE